MSLPTPQYTKGSLRRAEPFAAVYWNHRARARKQKKKLGQGPPTAIEGNPRAARSAEPYTYVSKKAATGMQRNLADAQQKLGIATKPELRPTPQRYYREQIDGPCWGQIVENRYIRRKARINTWHRTAETTDTRIYMIGTSRGTCSSSPAACPGRGRKPRKPRPDQNGLRKRGSYRAAQD